MTTKTFVDASVMVAIVGGEEDETKQAQRLLDAREPITSPIGVWEAAVAISRLRGVPVDAAREQLLWALTVRGVEIVAIGLDEANVALTAHARYGKRNHAAKLNMGDCFAYACAKTNNAALLYKGKDFAQTDLA